MRRAMMIVAMVAVIAMAGTAQAVVYDFTGAGGTDWNTAGNWTPGGPATLPNFDGGNDVTVLGAQSTTLAAGVGAQLGVGAGGITNVTINTTGTLTFGEYLLFYRNASGTVSHQNGAILVTQTAQNNGSMTMGRGPGTGTYTMTGGSVTLEHQLQVGGSGIGNLFDQQAGQVVVGDYTYIGTDVHRTDMMQIQSEGGAGTTKSATYRISGGSLEVNSKGPADFSHWGGLLLGGWWYYAAGPPTPVELYDGGAATFEVVGTGHDPAGITVNGDLAVGGNAEGGGRGALSFVMGSAGVTPITVNGLVHVAPPNVSVPPPGGDPIVKGDLLIDMTLLGAGVGDILLIDNDLVDPIDGEFLNNPEGTMYGAYTLTYLGGDGNDVVLKAPPVPEPAGLGLVGIALLAMRRRRS